MQLKNVRHWPLDIGGRILPAGGLADLDPGDSTIADYLSRGDLLEVSGAPAARGPIPMQYTVQEG